MKLTYYGHSCFSVTISGKIILFDPFITDNPLAASIDINSINADIIMVSHGHRDHVSDLLAIAQNTGALVISNYEVFLWVHGQGYTNAHAMNFGGSVKYDWGNVKFVVALHSSSLPDGSYGGNPGGFVVETDEGSFYYSGDTGLTYDFKLIGEMFDLDFAVLPVGDNFTMGIEEAIMCADFIKCDKIIGVHYDTFPSISIDKQEAVRHFENAGKELLLLQIGETIEL